MSQPPSGSRRTAQAQTPNRAERTIARRAAEARATIPDVELGTDVDLERALRTCAERDHSLTAVLVRATALALREHPRANAAYRDGQFELYERVNIGLLVADEDDLVIATLFDADARSVTELDTEIAELRRRAGALTHPERSGATFTVIHQERTGVAWQVPLVLGGQAAALAAGAVREVPVLRDGEVKAGHTFALTLACDHRILYGAPAARFLARIKELVEAAH